jgi:hypothetical protein
MNPSCRYEPSTISDSDCADLMTMAEREFSAFFSAVTQLFGSGQAELSAQDWLHELIEIDDLPTSARQWRLITTKGLTRLAGRVSTSSLSTDRHIA